LAGLGTRGSGLGKNNFAARSYDDDA
jgi:hypothetical protein